MSKRLYGSINVEKIKEVTDLLVKGEKGTYLPLNIWINDEQDQYGNIASVQVQIPKEAREAGQKGVYLGNFKLGQSGGGSSAPSQSPPPQNTSTDLPF